MSSAPAEPVAAAAPAVLSSTNPSTLTTLIHRLEAATARLEELALNPLVPATSHGSLMSHAAPASTTASDTPPVLAAYEHIITHSVKRYVDKSSALGDKAVMQQAQAVQELCQAQRDFIRLALSSKKPDFSSPTFQKLIRPTQAAIEKITTLREDSRTSPFFNHLSTVSEGIPAFGWVTVEPAPAPYIGEIKESAMFYANRVKKEKKGDGEGGRAHVEWADAYLAVLADLMVYVKACHTTGLTWNPRGVNAGEAAEKPMGVADRKALFSSLNAGEGITSALKKVDKASPAPPKAYGSAAKSAPPGGTKAGTAAAPSGPPTTELLGTKWVVENHPAGATVILDRVEKDQVVYIFNCGEAQIKIMGKVNAITVDKCTKSGIVVDSVVANLEVIGCKSLQVQITNLAPTVTVANTDGLQLFLGPAAVGLDLFTSKSTAVNMLFEEQAGSGDFCEKAIPEQFLSKIVDGRVVTTSVASG